MVLFQIFSNFFCLLRRANINATVCALFLLCISHASLAAGINNVRISHGSTTTRIVFDLEKIPSYKIFTLSNPERLVIDFKGFRQNTLLDIPSLAGTPIKTVRYAAFNKTTLRVVIELSQKVSYNAQTLAAKSGYPDRLSLDLLYPRLTTPTASSKTKPSKPSTQTTKSSPSPTTNNYQVQTNRIIPKRDIVIAIDPGHGGKDSGAIGLKGTDEKNVTLGVAKKLAALVNKTPGMRAYMTRNRDIFISLRGRTRRARENGADMFISIHADSFTKRSARGASVFVLSQHGASSEAAKILANSENAADLAGGISLSDKSDLLASVLLDLSQTASLEGSLEVANDVLSSLKKIGRLHSKRVESAAFVVLKSPDIPSILVETAFISNPTEERRLRSSAHQLTLAKAVFSGIVNYFHRNPLPGTTARQQHKVHSGESLGSIAKHYKVSVNRLINVNKLKSSNIHVGQVLTIP